MSLESLTNDYGALAESQKSVDTMQQRVNAEAALLVPRVLEHFNTWTANTLVPLMPEGYTVAQSTEARYTMAGFEIKMGSITGRQGFGDRCWPGQKAVDAIAEYERATPWVWRINDSFYYPK